MTELKTSWFVPLNKTKDAINSQVIFFPHAGATAYSYNLFSRCLPPFVQLLGVELPGKGTRLKEPSIKCFDMLINQLIEEIIPILTKNSVFFGHSMGALLAFECARRLEVKNKLIIKGLIVSGQASPNNHHVSKYLTQNTSDENLIIELKQLNGLSDEILTCPELLEILLANVRKDCLLIASYKYTFRQKLNCPLVCIVADQDPVADIDKSSNWRKETSNTVYFVEIKGGHFAFLQNIPLINTYFTSLLRL